MVNNSFSKIIEEFDPMDLSKSLELKRILNSYPYFQSASAHYLKTLKLQKKDAYFELLPKSAILTFNRSILRDWLYSSDINEDQPDDSKEKYSFLDWFDIIDEDSQKEIYDYFLEDAESDDISEAYEEFDGDYDEQELRLYRVKFISEVAN